jgi:hypothetical protein
MRDDLISKSPLILNSSLQFELCSSKGVMVECDNLDEFVHMTRENIIWLAVMQVWNGLSGHSLFYLNDVFFCQREKNF